MKMPSYQEFVRDRAMYYAFVTILALITIFGLWVRSQEKQFINNINELKECKEHSKVLESKIEFLHNKMLIIVQKESIKDSIK